MEWKALCGATGYIETEGALLATYHLSEKEIVLFDSGVEKSEELLALLDTLGVHVRAVLSTHLHVDHIANNEELVERHGAEVLAHEEEINVQMRTQHRAHTDSQSVQKVKQGFTFLYSGVEEHDLLLREVVCRQQCAFRFDISRCTTERFPFHTVHLLSRFFFILQ